MKKTVLILALQACAALSFAQITDPAPYCLYQPQFHYNMWEYIKVGTKTKQLGAMGSVSTGNNYQYYNGNTFESMAAGSNITIELKPYSVNDGEPLYFALYIDFNKNNAFDASEAIMQNSNTTKKALPTFGDPAVPITKVVTLPASLTAGKYRMRLVRDGLGGMVYNSNYTINPCVAKTTFGYGSAYDFDIQVTAPATGLASNIPTTPEFTIFNTITSGSLIVQSTANLSKYHYTIIAINGQAMEAQKLSEQIDITTLTNGLYFIAITNEENKVVYRTRFIKN